MVTPTLRRSFFGFHLTLGLTLLFLSARTVLEAMQASSGHSNPHVVILASIEAVGAVLFLFPRSLRAGGALLLLSIALAFLIHIGAGQFRGDLMVYGVGTWFVMVHGPAWDRSTRVAA